ncbi:MAG: hypothetical protein HGB04_10785 [Chlorobiaceae bacterium]|nr:hypothetical protein [Chlorobiaceae bacterium]
MKARKKSATRDLLRFFEIALFFAISVLGYGMLAKSSTSGSKSKSRTQLSETRNNLIPASFDRALREFRAMETAPTNPRLAGEHQHLSGLISALEAPVHLEHPDPYPIPSCHDSGQPSGMPSATLPLPGNLLQQNPVLLV